MKGWFVPPVVIPFVHAVSFLGLFAYPAIF
jgi:hypothetical protein